MKFNSIVDVVQEYGVKNVVVILPMSPLQYVGFIPGIALKSSNDELQLVTAFIEEDRYKVEDDYKITLAANDARYGREHFYICDLNNLIRNSGYRVCVLNEDGYTEVEFE